MALRTYVGTTAQTKCCDIQMSIHFVAFVNSFFVAKDSFVLRNCDQACNNQPGECKNR